MIDPREQKTPSPTPEQMVILLRYRLSKEQLAALVEMLSNRLGRRAIIEGLRGE